MCGIAGLVSPDVDRDRLERAVHALTHRGPDDGGLYLGQGAGLGARRLSIIDLGGGRQPLCNEDGTIWLSYNGEVFNAPELRARLEARGHQFKTRTDTEVIVHAYEEWGEDFEVRLRGMFAFAIWDAGRGRLVLARDRFGIKPLYYAQQGPHFAFASEIGPLFDLLPGLPRRLDREALWRLMEIGFIPAPLSAFEGVLKLPAAHRLSLDGDGVRLQPYWRLRYPSDGAPLKIDPGGAADQFVVRLREAVEAWRLSDVPVGSLLSGGVDSASLAALLAETAGGQIHTFTIGFTAASHDESALARETARSIGSHHHELTFTPADFDHLPRVVRHLEEPQCSATSVPIYLLYKACREAGFKVIMTGEGADELLGGYHWFDGDRRMRPLLRLPRPLRRALASSPVPASPAARRVLVDGPRDDAERYWMWQQVAGPQQLQALLTAAVPIPFARRWKSGDAERAPVHPLHRFLSMESRTRMTDFINFEVDRMSMASSVEARPPFLDHELWEFCAALPPECKLSPNGNKLLLRLGMRGRLPERVRYQPKQGLASPHAGWFRGPLPRWAEDALHPSALAETGYFHPGEVARLRAHHRTGTADTSRLLMGVLTAQLWHQAFAG